MTLEAYADYFGVDTSVLVEDWQDTGFWSIFDGGYKFDYDLGTGWDNSGNGNIEGSGSYMNHVKGKRSVPSKMDYAGSASMSCQWLLETTLKQIIKKFNKPVVRPHSHSRTRRSTTGNNTSTDSTQYTPHRHLWVPDPHLEMIDLICHVLFFVEIVVRLIFCPSFKRYFRSVLNWMDILLVIFYIVEMTINRLVEGEMYELSTADVLFVLRVCRVFKIFRLAHHHKGVEVLVYTLKASMKEILLLLMFLWIGVLIFSCLIYFTDHGEDKFQSIPHCFWWSIITMTTVGYGDMYPETDWGKLVGTACAVCGVLLIAFTVPIIVNNFMMFYELVEYGKHPPNGKDLNKSHCEGIAVSEARLSEIPCPTVQAWA